MIGLPIGIPQTAVSNIPTFNRPAPVVKPQPVNEKQKSSVNYYGDFGGCGWWRMQMPETMINYSRGG